MAMVRLLPLPFQTPKRFGLGLLPQGGISLAMAISGVLTYAGLGLGDLNAVDLLFSVVVLGVILSELTGPVFTRNVLVRAGEISPRVEEALAAGNVETAHVEAMHPDPEGRPDSPDGRR
jgi:hypothetical protein